MESWNFFIVVTWGHGMEEVENHYPHVLSVNPRLLICIKLPTPPSDLQQCNLKATAGVSLDWKISQLYLLSLLLAFLVSTVNFLVFCFREGLLNNSFCLNPCLNPFSEMDLEYSQSEVSEAKWPWFVQFLLSGQVESSGVVNEIWIPNVLALTLEHSWCQCQGVKQFWCFHICV